MRRILVLVLSALMVLGGTALLSSPAHAAPKKVTIKKFAKRYVGWDGTATVKPLVRKTKAGKKAAVKITRKTVTVKQRGKVVRKNRKSVRLRPGTYRMAVKATYTEKAKKRTAKKSFRTKVVQGRCATAADLRSLKADPQYVPEVVGDSIATVSKKLRSKGAGTTYTIAQLRTEIEKVIAFIELFGIDGDPEVKEMLAELEGLKTMLDDLEAKGVTTLEDREYRGCGGEMSVYASFAQGELLFADAESELDFELSAAKRWAGALR